MKRLLPILLGLVQAAHLYAQSAPADGASPARESQKCSVSGTVLRKDTGEPLSKAKVQLVNREKSEDSTFDVTDAQGNFVLEDLACQSYLLSVSHPGFVEANYGQRVPTDPGAVLALAPGQKLTGLLFKLQRTAVITGRVFDETGQLVEGAAIHVIRSTRRGKQRDFREAASDTTNDLGEFRVYGLDPGRYYIAVVYDPWAVNYGFTPVPKRRLLKKGYPPLFYPDTIDASRAQSFVVASGDEIPSINFNLQLTSMNTVSGKILNLPPAADRDMTQVYLFPDGMNLSGSGLRNLESQVKDGSFTIYRVPPGSYFLQAVHRDRESGRFSAARRKLEVSDTDIDGVTLVFVQGYSLRGHLTWEGTRPAKDSGASSAFLASTEEDSLSMIRPEEIKPDGSFLLRNVTEGEYNPRIFTSDEDCFVKSVRLGPTQMVEGKLQIPSGTDNILEFVVSCRAAHIDGQVLTSDSLPAAGVFVVAIPQDRPGEDHFHHFDTRTDQNGHFLLKGLLPGDYKLFSWSGIEEGDWEDPEFLKPFEEKGTSVHLDDGDHATKDLTLIDISTDTAPKQ